jgi:hypothetical protein
MFKTDITSAQLTKVAELFRYAKQFIEFVEAESASYRKVDYPFHHLLAEEQSAEIIAGLFNTDEEFIKLAKASGVTACRLARQQSAKIAGLFKADDQFIELAKASSDTARCLAEQQSAKIMGLFKSEEKFNELGKVDKNLFMYLKKIRTDNASRTFFNGSATDSASAIPSSEQDVVADSTPTCQSR